MKPYEITLDSTAKREKAVRTVWRAPEGYRVTFAEPKRSDEQNKRLWAMLGDVSQQIEYYGAKRSPEAWKDIFSAALRDVQTVPSLDGKGIVQIGLRTSKMSVAEMSDLFALIEEWGARNGVVFREREAA